MSYINSAKKIKFSKVDYEQYLANMNEPHEGRLLSSSHKPKYDLDLDAPSMRRKFRKIASDLRSTYNVFPWKKS